MNSVCFCNEGNLEKDLLDVKGFEHCNCKRDYKRDNKG